MPTSARAILHHTDQNGPNILKGSVIACQTSTVQLLFKGTIMKLFLEAILGLAIAHSEYFLG